MAKLGDLNLAKGKSKMRFIKIQYIDCIYCHQQYDIARESGKAKKNQAKNIFCPRCGNKVGSLSK
jgi:hypothetical protein